MEKEVSRLSAGFAFQTEGKNLGIGYNQLWGDAQGLQGCFQAVCRAAHNGTSLVQKFPHGLDLRKDQTSFGGLKILRHDQQNQITGLRQRAGDGKLPKSSGRACAMGLAKLRNLFPCFALTGKTGRPPSCCDRYACTAGTFSILSH